VVGVVEAATDEVHDLAEGPVWDPSRQRLLWVDILRGLVLEGVLDDGRVRETARHEFEGTVGAVAVAADGTLLVAGQESLVVLAPDGTAVPAPRVLPKDDGRRLNDGAVDPAGRFLVGSLHFDGESDREILVRLERDGSLTVLDEDLTLSNGLAWSGDGTRMYSVDTLRRTVFVRDYDPESGDVGPRRTHLVLEDGYPDGAAMDAEDHLWLAVWGAGELRRYAPDGQHVQTLSVPAPHTSSLAFAGPDLRTLVITTAAKELSGDQRRAFPDSGRLFTAQADVPGLPVPLWSGPSTVSQEHP
jgi:sugar lactone lactonase YvrE